MGLRGHSLGNYSPSVQPALIQGRTFHPAGKTETLRREYPNDAWIQPLAYDRYFLFRFLYTLFVAVDANFKLKGKERGLTDIELGPGWASFVAEDGYQVYISNYEDEGEVRQHHAILLCSMILTEPVDQHM